MKFVRDMGIGSRLGLGFALVLLCAIAVTGLALREMRSIQGSVETIVNVRTTSLVAAMEMREIVSAVALGLRRISAPKDGVEGARESTRLAQSLAAYGKAEARLRTDADDPLAPGLIAAAAREHQSVLPLITAVMQHAQEGNYFDAASLLGSDFAPRHAAWADALTALAEHQQRATHATHEELQSQQAQAQVVMLIAGALAVAVGAAVAWWITQTIVVPMSHAGRAADTIARRDLSEHIAVTSRDQSGKLAASLAAMQGSLRHTVVGIRQGADVLAAAAGDIAVGNAELAIRTGNQAQALEAAVSTMQELMKAVRQTAESADQARRLVGDAQSAAVHGGKVMAETIVTMDAVRNSAQKMVGIIGVIDALASQTNGLALNASVEAAQAGVHGAGFAVVAGQVRELAQRSSAAASEVKSLIGASFNQIGGGVAHVGRVGRSMEEIAAAISQAAALIGEISGAGREQSAGMVAVDRALVAIDGMNQQNATLVEESAAAFESMRMQTEQLVASVAVFKTGVDDARPRPQARKPQTALS